MGKRTDPEDIIGRQFGELTVVECAGKDSKRGRFQYKCICGCGREKTVSRDNLLNGSTRSCGHLKNIVDPNDIAGCRFGNLMVLKYIGMEKRHRKYLCKCDCGNTHEAFRDNLLGGGATSCGRCHSCQIEYEEDHYRYTCADGDSFLFDEVDYDLAVSHRWYVDSNGYPKTNDDGKIKLFSRLALDCGEGQYVDHVNGNTRDNRRSNLRIATPRDNSRNAKMQCNNRAGYKGVSLHRGGKYRADIGFEGKNLYLGLYEEKESAAEAYDNAARKIYGEYARVNFPLPGEQGCREVACI